MSEGKISRRQFLKKAGVLLGGSTTTLILASGKIEQELIGAAINFISNPSKANTLKDIAHQFGNEKENPNFRPIDVIISEGISSFESTTGKRVCFQRSPDYQPSSYYQNQIQKIKDSIGLLAQDPKSLIQPFIDSFPPTANREYIESEFNIGGWLDSLPKGGGMYANLTDAGKVVSSNEIIKRVEKESKDLILESKNFIERKVKENNNKPVSASVLFSFFLQKNGGNISQSLDDTYGFLKFASRNSFETGDIQANSQNIAWMKTHVLDEYGIKPYDKETNDLINLIGKPYHTWNLVAMLTYFPADIVEPAGVFRQLTHLDKQGAAKLNSDLLTLSDLNKTEAILLEYH